MSEELDYCPFCGSRTVHLALETRKLSNAALVKEVERAYVECIECSARGPEDPRIDIAIEGWNSRSTLAEHLKELEAQLNERLNNPSRTSPAQETS